MFPEFPTGQPIALDFETSGLRYWDPDFRVLGVAVATGEFQDYWDIRENPQVVDWLRDMLPGRTVVAHFAQFEIQCCRVLKIDPRSVARWYCTMTAECLIDEHALQYDLYNVTLYRVGNSDKHIHLQAIADALGVTSMTEAVSRLAEAPVQLVRSYGSSDAGDAFRVFEAQRAEIDRQELWEVLDLECMLTPVLADMSWHGIRVNVEGAHAAIPKLDEQGEILQSDINEIVGGKFNVNSTPQIRAYFKPEPVSKYQWRLVDGTMVGPTKGNKGPSIDAKALLEIRHPLAAKILALRKTIKLRDTFIRGHVIGSADREGYVHTTFNQTRNDADAGTVTGRLSSTGPALQQITKRDKVNAAILRSFFLPDEGQQWLCADYSQVDFRCGAHLQNDPNVIAAYEANPALDYHQIVSDMTGIPRNAPYAGAPYTKQINLGLSFGAGVGKLAFMMNMPYTVRELRGKMSYVAGPEATKIFELYHMKLPAVQKFMKRAEAIAKETHYVRTAIGRRLRFPGGRGAHKAAGLLYQAYAADLHKFGLVRVDALIRGDRLPARLMMSCHDEIGVSTENDPEIARRISSVYTDFNSDSSPIRMRVPITASCKFGSNWWDASKD